MRITGALKTDFKFQMKQGFYIIYFFLTIIYMVILSMIPKEFKNIILPIIVFSDPSVVGFFFIGGIIMLEKLQGIINYIVVTPLSIKEYILSKVFTLSLLAVIAGEAITFVSINSGSVNNIILAIGIFISSVFFILIGIIVVVGCKTLNQYMVKMVPFLMLLIIPCISIIDFKFSYILTVIPSVAGFRIVYGAFNDSNIIEAIGLITYVVIIDYLLLHKVEKIFENKIVYGG
ncbi:fluoroquinolone export ABC transporter permease subunit [Vallitalea guaymasensis]|uniref:fluoroquinolone export ABC transporter permease subunit n=1 Tax=Vallitalea guaymasensis TaxID=1185412 RepID=UPI00272B4787|nr:ABC transporter permease [Vallitalea guaymasensis]